MGRRRTVGRRGTETSRGTHIGFHAKRIFWKDYFDHLLPLRFKSKVSTVIRIIPTTPVSYTP